MSPDELRTILNKPGIAALNPRADSELQKQQASRPGPNAAHGQGYASENARNRGRFTVAIKLGLGNRLQDPDGALCTVMDCLCRARKRFADAHSRDSIDRRSDDARGGNHIN